MIGVSVAGNDLRIAEEFFELFKTPWERAVPGRRYRIVLSADGCIDGLDADVFLVYGSAEHEADRREGISMENLEGPVEVRWGDVIFPIYGRVALFGRGPRDRELGTRGHAVEHLHRSGERVVRRIGYDLFDEIRYLLTQGQPVARASIPTCELHIEFLRQCLIEARVPFLEIPPRPIGHEFICCLTHDVDFYGIRRHKFDRTLAGFLARASVGSFADFVRGRRSLAEAARNWLAICSLPLVFAGLIRDFWRPFEDYAKVEDARRSTFFLVPFKGKAGMAPDGTSSARRAVSYGIGEIQTEVRMAATRGSELAVHGIDAWRDADAGRAEMAELSSVTGQEAAGVRMHWLYLGPDSAARIEGAGFDYDSTWGYNDAVGYRAGTTQAFRLMDTAALMELPMSIMDSALFFPARMGLDRASAWQRCRRIIADARRFGGALVINWHERSLAPERLWGRFYGQLLGELRAGNSVLFLTAGQAVRWFRWRRSISFRQQASSDITRVDVSAPAAADPGAVIRIHRFSAGGADRREVAFHGGKAIEVEV